MSKLLIGITSYGRVDCTKRCLESLSNLDTTDDITIVIFDNGSKSEIQEYLKQWDNKEIGTIRFHVMLSNINFGVGKALNQILKKYRTPDMNFLKLDNDTIFPTIEVPGVLTPDLINKKCLSQMLDFVDNNEGGRFKAIAAYFYDKNRSTCAPIEFIKTTTGNTYEIENPKNHVCGFCSMWHKDVMNNLKEFSENYVYGFEDTEFSQRSLQFGENAWARWLNPNIKHYDPQNLPESAEILDIKAKSLRGEIKVP